MGIYLLERISSIGKKAKRVVFRTLEEAKKEAEVNEPTKILKWVKRSNKNKPYGVEIFNTHRYMIRYFDENVELYHYLRRFYNDTIILKMISRPGTYNDSTV